ncbi:MAG: rRNA maturation RNase YbeY [Candidatus Parcubacteria bacterium]|nr:rRNA maturation RNase YbeY [Candidatus Parcubacteria bacterium]
MSEEGFQIRINTKSNPPISGLPFSAIKDDVLGKKYDLSLVFIGSTLSRRLNREMRGKDKPANVLSFPLSEKSGEIFIDVPHATRQSPQFEETPKQFIAHLFIHGLYHLKGLPHGDTMEREEEKTRKKFSV